MTTALTVAAPVTGDEMDLIRNTIAKDATPDELKLFLYDCQRQGTHPLDRLLHFTKRAGKYTPITSIDFMRIRAAETGELAGSDDAVFTGTPAQNGFEAHVTVYRLVQGQRCAFSATARWSEYKPDQAFMWNKMPHTMLGKCAEALALRKGFPRQLAGLYAKEEMDQAEKAERKQNVVPTPATQALMGLTPVGEDALPLDQHIIKALKPGNGPAVGIAVTHRGEELYIVKDDVLEIAKGLLESGKPMIGVTATKNKRTFVKEFMSPEAAVERHAKPQDQSSPEQIAEMLTSDSIPF